MSSELAEIFAEVVSFGDLKDDDSSGEIDVPGRSCRTMSAELGGNVSGVSIDDVSEVDAEGDDAICPVSAVFNNELLLKHLASNLDFDSFKSFRAVSKLWRNVTAPQFRQRALALFTKMIKSLPQHNVLDLEGIKGVKSLKIEICFMEKSLFEFGVGVITLLAPHLNSLALEFYSQKISFFSPGQIQFPSLVKLGVSGFRGYMMTSHILPWLAAAPNLKELVVGRLNLFGGDGRFVLNQLLNSDGTRNCLLVPSLSSLIVAEGVPSHSLPFLINFPQNWERLDLQITDAGWTSDCESVRNLIHELELDDLEQLMEKNKNCLISLKLHFGILNRKVLQFNIPKFPNLKELNLVLTYLTFDIDFGQNSKIKYSATFPTLEVLSIDIKTIGSRIDRLENVWRTFFSPQVFKGLRLLELNFDKLVEKLLRDRGVERNWASKMFPNARLENL